MADPDVIVIGGGASGLAAATELARRGWRVRILEARARLGGRIYSMKPKGWPVPIELGAEFVHGGTKEVRDLLPLRRIETKMWRFEQGQLTETPGYWEMIGKVAAKIPRRDRGWSFEDFLRHERGRIAPDVAKLAAAYAGSFNAAPIDQISAHALREHRAGADTEDFKVAARYDSLVTRLRKQWPKGRVEVGLESVVKRIRWDEGSAIVQTGTKSHAARAAIITLPLGVLKANHVKFFPPLAEKQSIIRRAGWGQVIRVVFRFRPGFWTSPMMPQALGMGQGSAFGFINAPSEAVPVWWALMPPSPVLTGWVGGEAANQLARLTPNGVREKAIGSLANIFSATRQQVKGWLADWRFHDWRRDPFSLGAYSFPVAGQENIPERLAEPVRSTLFFCGEATAAEYGTVHGAVESGTRAAREVGAVLEKAALGNTPPVTPFPVGI